MRIKLIAAFLLLGSFIFALRISGPAEVRAAEPQPGAPAISGNGPHDFDFELGRWKIHIRRARSQLTVDPTNLSQAVVAVKAS